MNRSLRWSMPFTLLLTLAPVPSAVAQEVAGECPLCQVGARWADRFQLRESEPVRNRPRLGCADKDRHPLRSDVR